MIDVIAWLLVGCAVLFFGLIALTGLFMLMLTFFAVPLAALVRFIRG